MSEADELGLTRTPGLHLTDIIQDIAQSFNDDNEWCTEKELAFFGAGGFMWERIFSRAYAESIKTKDLIRPGEFEVDGIIGSPDLIRVSDYTLVETKATWSSVRKWENLERWFWKWIVQTSCYCHMIGTDTVEIHAFFLCGDWQPPVPQVRATRLEYGQDEINQRWEMCLNHAHDKGWL